MELNDIKSLWQAYDSKLEKAVRLNHRFMELIETQKMKSRLAPLFWRRIFEAILQTAWIIFLLVFLYRNVAQLVYAASAVILIAFFMIALVNSIRQLSIIRRMDYSNDIVTIQGALVMLQAKNLNFARMVVLFIPAMVAFPSVVSKAIKDFHIKALGDFDIMTLSGGHWWTAQLAASLALIPLCIWCYTQLTYKNIDKKWVKDFFQRSSGTRVRKAAEFMKELHSLKYEVI
jgi:hypothetical protein